MSSWGLHHRAPASAVSSLGVGSAVPRSHAVMWSGVMWVVP